MRDGDVIPLEVVVDVDLPVALHDVVAALHELHLIHGEARGGDLAWDRAEHLFEWWRIGAEVGEDERSEDGGAHGDEAEVLFAEPLGLVHLWAVLKGTVESIRPAVIAALQALAIPLAQRHLAGAMSADIMEARDRAIEAVHQDNRLVEDVGRHKVARSREVGGARHDLPGSIEDCVSLALVDLGREVLVGGQGVCLAGRNWETGRLWVAVGWSRQAVTPRRRRVLPRWRRGPPGDR